MTLEWAGELGEDDVPLTTSLGAEQTTAEDWEFDPEEDRHTYSGDARALIATLSRLESQTLFVSIPEGSASFAMAGLSVVAVPLGTACGWTGG